MPNFIPNLFGVDAFTADPFSGNPAAVCLLDRSAPDTWMQNLAHEMNLSETAFLYRQEGSYALRWFTPTLEEELCGHATLASAHILWEENREPRDKTLRFNTKSGELTARSDGDWIWLDFPSLPPAEQSAPAALLEALNVKAIWYGKAKLDVIVEVASEQIVRSLKPDFSKLALFPTRAVIVTSASSTNSFDFVSRVFAPRGGVPEDPVTGSAHCTLAPYWEKKLGKKKLRAFQASARGGTLRLETQGDRVLLGGQAVTVYRGERKVTP